MFARACLRVSEGRRWRIGQIGAFAITWVAYTMTTAGRSPFAISKSALHPEHLSAAQPGWAPFNLQGGKELLGLLDASFMTAYAIGMPFMGILADRLHRSYFLCFSLVANAAFLSLFALGHFWQIHSFLYFCAVTFMCGLGQSIAFPCTMGIMQFWFAKHNMGRTLGIWSTCGTVGNIIGKLMCTASLHDWGWSFAFFVPAAGILGSAVLVALFLVQDPHDVRLPRVDESKLDDNLLQAQTASVPLKKILSLRSLPFYALATLFAKLVYYAFSNWLPYFLQEKMGFEQVYAGYASTVFDFGGLFGGIVGGWLSDRLGSPGIVCFSFQLLSCPMMLLYVTLGPHVGGVASIALLFWVGVFVSTPYYLITTVASIDLGRHPDLEGNTQAVGTVTGIIDGSGSLGAAIQGPLIGFVSTALGWDSAFYALVVVSFASSMMMVPPALVERKQKSAVMSRPNDVRTLSIEA